MLYGQSLDKWTALWTCSLNGRSTMRIQILSGFAQPLCKKKQKTLLYFFGWHACFCVKFTSSKTCWVGKQSDPACPRHTSPSLARCPDGCCLRATTVCIDLLLGSRGRENNLLSLSACVCTCVCVCLTDVFFSYFSVEWGLSLQGLTSVKLVENDNGFYLFIKSYGPDERSLG